MQTPRAHSASTYSVLAVYSGSTNFSGSSDNTHTLTLTQASQTIHVTTAAPASSAYNGSFPVAATASSGLPVSIAASGGCSGGSSSGAATILMTSGTQTCTVTFSQTGNANYKAATSVGESVTAQKASTTTSITSNSPNPSVVSQAVTISFTVTGNGTPSGSVTVKASTGESCTGSAPAGSCNITFSTAVNRTLTATYAGDSNFSASTSTATVNQSVGGSTIQASPATQTISSGHSASYTVTLTSLNGLTGNVSLACTGGPPNSTCAVSPTTLMLNHSVNFTVMLSTAMNVNHGTFKLTFTGTLGSLKESTTVSLTVK
jgi:hypothetical protein